MSILSLPDWAKGALWIGLGALLGFAVGALLIDADTAFDLAWLWFVLVIAYVGGVLYFARKSAPPAAAPAPARPAPVAAPTPPPRPVARPAAPARPSALHFAFHLPDVPAGFPPVMGHNEALRLHLRVTHLGKPAAGAAVRLTGQIRDGAQFVAGEGVTGSDGSLSLTVRPHGTGELLLEAEAKHDNTTGFGSASVSIVRYDEEIERLFGEFRAYATSVLGPDSATATARELSERLRAGSPPAVAKALLELARVYELVAYGERDADRALYLTLIRSLLVLERGALPEDDDPAAGGAGSGGPGTRTAEV